MSLRAFWFITAAAATPLVARAQQPRSVDVDVVRAVVEYYQGARFKGPIVIDVGSETHRGPLVSSAVVDRVVQTTGSAKGAAADYLGCREEFSGGRKRQVCETRRGAKAVVSLSDLVIRNDTATVAVYYRKAPTGRLEAVEEALTLVKGEGGRWTVVDRRETGVS